MTRALLLDLDGTLADSLGVMKAAYLRFLESRGRVGSDAEFDSLNGPPLDEVVSRLRSAHGLEESQEELIATYLATVGEIYLGVPVRDGGLELLERAREAGWSVGVVTSNSDRVVAAWLGRQGIDVDVVVTAGDVERGKPDPEPFAVGLRRLDADAERSVAVEDSPAGAQAALAAGLRTFVVGERGAAWPVGARWLPGLAEVSEAIFGA